MIKPIGYTFLWWLTIVGMLNISLPLGTETQLFQPFSLWFSAWLSSMHLTQRALQHWFTSGLIEQFLLLPESLASILLKLLGQGFIAWQIPLLIIALNDALTHLTVWKIEMAWDLLTWLLATWSIYLLSAVAVSAVLTSEEMPLLLPLMVLLLTLPIWIGSVLWWQDLLNGSVQLFWRWWLMGLSAVYSLMMPWVMSQYIRIAQWS